MLKFFNKDEVFEKYDILVVGAGPVGIALALACEEKGHSVLLLESGLMTPNVNSAALSSGHIVDPQHHASPDVAICRGLGGTSRWWGGRCVPFDDVDFITRPHLTGTEWPITHAEISQWYPDAASFFGIGHALFRAPVTTSTNQEKTICFESLERWTPIVNMGERHRKRLQESTLITVLLGATVTSLDLSLNNDVVNSVLVSNTDVSKTYFGTQVVLACGGLETTRLLLATQVKYPSTFGGKDGVLGRYYMGHMSGKIADIVLDDPDAVAQHDFFLDDGAYARRRFSLSLEVQLQEQLLNTSFWVDNAPFSDVNHRSGILSMVWLALATPIIGRHIVSEGVRLSHLGVRPYRWIRHILNVLSSPFSTTREIFRILQVRFFQKPAMPGFIVRNNSGRYALHYHSEHAPREDSCVTLSQQKDPLGMPFLNINIKFHKSDAQAIRKSHVILDKQLRKLGLGRLEYYLPEPHAQEQGMVRSLSIAGTPECIQAGLSKKIASFIQFPDTPFMGAVPTLIGNLPLEKLPVFVTHGVFGSGVYERLLTVSDEVKKALLRTAQRHGLGDNVSMADLLLAFAFANNHNGVVITSMFSSDHIEHNCQIAERIVSPSFADDIRNILKVGG